MAYASGGGSSLQCVVIGDLNNDTNMDIVLANYGTNNIGILLGYGNGNFENQMMLSTGINSHPTSIAIGDFNGDSVVDIAVANYGTKQVGMMLGYGNATFTSQTSEGTSFDSRPLAMASGDFNNDKRSEIAIIYDRSDNVDIFVAYNRGTFAKETRYSVGSTPRSVAVGDFNNDTRLDIVVANWWSDDVSVLLGYGNGSFSKETRYSTGFRPQFVAVGDFNNDTRLDIVVANYGDDDVSVLLGYGNGSFAQQTNYSVGSWPYSVAVGDFNNDTRLDIVVANWVSSDVSVLLGYGNGSFAKETRYSVGFPPYSVAIGDFNNDTRLDIVVTNWVSSDVSVLLGYGNGSFAKERRYSVGSHPLSIAVGDFNNDTRLDIVVANKGSNDVSVLLGYGNGSFAEQTRYLVGSQPYSVAIGDFNNDTRLDIIVVNSDSNDVSVLLGCDYIVFVKEMMLMTGNGSRPQSLVISDFNNDDQMDIGVVNSREQNIGIFLGYGNISFANQVTYSPGLYSSPCSMAVGDFNNDTRMDIVFASCDADSVGIILGYGNGSFGNVMPYSTGSSSSRYSVAVGDINNDTLEDVVIANYDNNNLGVFLGYGNGTFASIILFPLDYGSNPFSIVVGDFNNDRKLDIAVANSGTDSLNILLQTC
ncbi:unnamed protein product [Rotaria sp. Silwood1]|nr:unnamed protein product [Rotaria sp. Silwood1]